MENLVPDKYFDAFTRPIINKKFEEKVCGEGPKLEVMFEDDQHLKNLELKCRECLNAAFNAAQLYADTFLPYRVFYKENELTDVDQMRVISHDVEFFADSLEKYHRQEEMARLIVSKRNLGMLLVDAIEMKNKLIPNPVRCLDVVNEILPLLAKKATDSIISEGQEAIFKLENKPTNTLEYVNSLTFLEEIQERVCINHIYLVLLKNSSSLYLKLLLSKKSFIFYMNNFFIIYCRKIDRTTRKRS